jgi:ornithine cyclodeaminase
MAEQSRPIFLFLQQEEVIAAGGLDMEMVLDRTELAFRMFETEELVQPVKPMIQLPNERDRQYLMVAMPVYMRGEINRAGIKWAAESKDNARRGDLPYGIDVLILHDVERAHPLAVMDGTLITAMRTGASAGVAAKHLAREGAQVAGLIGAGVVGKTALEAIGLAVPSVKQFRVFDLNAQKARDLREEFSDRWEVIVADSVRYAVERADIISTQTTATDPMVAADWVKEGCFFAQLGKNEAEGQVLLQADQLVVDELEMVRRYQGIPYDLYHSGQLEDGDFVSLSAVVRGEASGRRSPEDRNVFLSHGMGSLDLAVAAKIYENAAAQGLGVELSLWEETHLKLG